MVAAFAVEAADGGAVGEATYRVVQPTCVPCSRRLAREDFGGLADCGNVEHSATARACVLDALDAGRPFRATGNVFDSYLAWSVDRPSEAVLFLGEEEFGRLRDGGFEVVHYSGLGPDQRGRCSGTVVRETCPEPVRDAFSLFPGGGCRMLNQDAVALCVEGFRRSAAGPARPVAELQCGSYYSSGYDDCRRTAPLPCRTPSRKGPNLICALHGRDGMRCLPEERRRPEAGDARWWGLLGAEPPCAPAHWMRLQTGSYGWRSLAPDGGLQRCPARDTLFDGDREYELPGDAPWRPLGDD
jgi:hypothetical protein